MEQYRIPRLARACEILEIFVESEAPLSSSEVARRVSIPRTTAIRIPSAPASPAADSSQPRPPRRRRRPGHP